MRIERAGVGPATAPDGTVHKSETSLDAWPFEYRVKNDGSLDDFLEHIDTFPGVWEEDRYFKWYLGDDKE